MPRDTSTVANFLLMSLGPRSAPEILLAIVGIVANGFQQDSLGPSLIVGSGAFNLLFLTAIRYLIMTIENYISLKYIHIILSSFNMDYNLHYEFTLVQSIGHFNIR